MLVLSMLIAEGKVKARYLAAIVNSCNAAEIFFCFSGMLVSDLLAVTALQW